MWLWMMALPHGHKRRPDDGLESEQRLSKRFNLLNIGRLAPSIHGYPRILTF